MRGMRSKAVETKEDFFRTHTFMLRMNGRYSRILPALPTKYKRMTSTGQVQDILHTESANPREIVERMKREQTTHLGKDLMDGQD